MTCPDCIGASPLPGIRWPVNANGDTSHGWVERCDLCEQYGSDEQAARVLAEHLGLPVEHGHIAGGMYNDYPYIDEGGQV